MSASDADSVKRELREEVRRAREHSERLTKLEALGTRAVACRRWRWMPGMLGLSTHSSSRSIWIRIVDPPLDDTSECWPDLSDPATLGCLLALVREAWSLPSLYVRLNPYGTDKVQLTWSGSGSTTVLALANAETEAEGLVKALEAAE
jgi:hypothetical protein